MSVSRSVCVSRERESRVEQSRGRRLDAGTRCSHRSLARPDCHQSARGQCSDESAVHAGPRDDAAAPRPPQGPPQATRQQTLRRLQAQRPPVGLDQLGVLAVHTLLGPPPRNGRTHLEGPLRRPRHLDPRTDPTHAAMGQQEGKPLLGSSPQTWPHAPRPVRTLLPCCSRPAPTR